MLHTGSCHCGQIRFTVEGDLDQAMECNCSHCARKGYLLWFVPRAAMTLETPPEALATYTFNKHQIQHHFCPSCGCAPFGFGEMQGTPMTAVNIRCLEDLDLGSVERSVVDGKSL